MRIAVLLFCFFSWSLSAQNYYDGFDKELKDLIDQGDACLKAKEPNCKKYLDEVLALARQKPDSTLAMAYHEVGVSYSRYGELPVFLEYINKGLQETSGENHPLVTAALYRKKTYAFARMGPVDSILPTIDTAMLWAKRSGDNEGITEVYIQHADLLHRLGDATAALELLQEAKPYAKASGLQRQLAGIEFTMGNIYLSNFDFKEAVQSLQESMTIAKGDDEMYYRSMVNWSIAMIQLDSVQPVIEQLPEAITFFRNRNLIWTAKTHLAHAYAVAEQYEKSIPLHEECLAQAEQIFDPSIISLNQRLLAKGYLETGKPEKALQYSESVFNYESQKGTIDEQVMGAYVVHGNALGLSGRTDEAFAVMRQIPQLVDSLAFITKQRELKQLQELYETEKKEAQIALLEEKETTSKLQKGLLVAGLLAVLGVLGALWVRFRESKKRATLEREKLDAEIEHKQKELTTHALHLAKKNEILVDLKQKVEQMGGGCETRDIINTINFDLKDEASWEYFTQYFEKVHTDFSKNAQQRYPNVTSNELRFMALVRMNLSSKEIANILNITPDGVKKARQRLRKKMALTPEDSLEAEIINL